MFFRNLNITNLRDNISFFKFFKEDTIRSFFLSFIKSTYWTKTRTSYTVNSWVYTTNHKRISINYFNFVLVAGTAGMSLATVIRLEFAYPGVGVLAGDSLQYLSTATAHGVIMVFYMIMPAIFGAFGNFLLPTQLGVHDVAFPRLNSAAFWFLPGGLIMLCQLVCTDRRYARMNCFNIRELQGILKRKFFVDLVNSHDHKSILEESMIGMRYKANQSLNTDLDYTTFYNFGLHTGRTRDNTNYTFLNNLTTSSNRVFIDGVSYKILRTLDSLTPLSTPLNTIFLNFFSRLYNTIIDSICILLTLNPFASLIQLFNLNLVISTLLNNFNFFYTKSYILEFLTF